MNSLDIHPPYFGAAYYPEDWPEGLQDEDIRLMKEAGMNLMRIGEFAWSRMEPDEGQFEFDWLHRIVDKLAANGIGTIMCTPTATPPIWAVRRYPEVLYVNADGIQWDHGGRRHYCPNSPIYHSLSRTIATKLAIEFANDPAVIGWQIDNEIYSAEGDALSCSCSVCVSLFHEFIRERYGTIAALNDAWCLTLWSQEYQNFGQIPTLKRQVWQNPSLIAAWREFGDKSYVEYTWKQADVLHAHNAKMVSTNVMCIPGFDHYEVAKKLDVVMYDHYNFGPTVRDAAFWFDLIRPIKPDQPYWNVETCTNFNGSIIACPRQIAGYTTMNTWMSYLMGGEHNGYWLWRQHRAGHEQMHGYVVDSHGRKPWYWHEVTKVADGLKANTRLLAGTKLDNSGFAIHYTNLAYNNFRALPMVPGPHMQERMVKEVYLPLTGAQFRPDIIDSEADLSRYKMIYTPYMQWLDEDGLTARLKAWIEAGGTWIAGAMCDIRDQHLSKFPDSPFSVLEQWGGVYCEQQIQAEGQPITIKLANGHTGTGHVWCNAFSLHGADALAHYTEYPAEGLAAVTLKTMGKGRIVILGCMPDPISLVAIMRVLGESIGVKPVAKASANVLVIPRSGSAGSAWGVMEIEAKLGELTLPHPMTDVLTGTRYEGIIELAPYQVLLLV